MAVRLLYAYPAIVAVMAPNSNVVFKEFVGAMKPAPNVTPVALVIPERAVYRLNVVMAF